MQNPLIVALDVPDAARALHLAETLAPVVGAVKVGKELFVSEGPDIVRHLRAAGASVFLDLKFHDIPNTVAAAVAAAVRLDVQMLTVHASGGLAMLRAAQDAAETAARELNRPAPWVLAVTVLTSLDDADLASVGVAGDAAAQVERLANLACTAGLQGLVCSPRELPMLRRALPRSMRLITPGIRPAESAAGDQKRTMTPAEAMEAGADGLVIGRPITLAADPCEAARRILESLLTRPVPSRP